MWSIDSMKSDEKLNWILSVKSVRVKPHMRKNSCLPMETKNKLCYGTFWNQIPTDFVRRLNSSMKFFGAMWNESLLFSSNFYKKFKNDVFVSQ